MIIVNCPYCGKQHILSPIETEILIKRGNVIVTDCTCMNTYIVEQGYTCYFTKKNGEQI